MGHVVSEIRSLGQILEKPCVRPRGQIFSPIIMKLGQNVCLNEICIRSRGHIFSSIILKLGQNVCLDEIWDEFENGSGRLQTRSPGQILEKGPAWLSGKVFDL